MRSRDRFKISNVMSDDDMYLINCSHFYLLPKIFNYV